MYKQYKRTNIAEMTPWTEDTCTLGVSISEADRKNGSPKHGDMIARNPDSHLDMWLVAEEYFSNNFEISEPAELIEAKALTNQLFELLQKAMLAHNTAINNSSTIRELLEVVMIDIDVMADNYLNDPDKEKLKNIVAKLKELFND